jgi:hypothetical protein
LNAWPPRACSWGGWADARARTAQALRQAADKILEQFGVEEFLRVDIQSYVRQEHKAAWRWPRSS